MLNFFESLKVVGLEALSFEIKGARVSLKQNKPVIESLFSLVQPLDQITTVKQLYEEYPLIVTGLDSSDILVRPLYIPLTKEKDLDAAFVFQAEPSIPYPIDQAVLTRQMLNQTAEGTHLTLMSVQKDHLQNHLDDWKAQGVEPEQVACVQSALCQFGSAYLSNEKAYLVLHVSDYWMTCILVEKGKLIASYAMQDGLELIRTAYESQHGELEYFDQINFDTAFLSTHPALSEAMKKLQQSFAKMSYALVKDYKQEPIEGVLVTGNGLLFPFFGEKLTEKSQMSLLHCNEESGQQFGSQKLQCYAVPIGLAVGALLNPINFRQQELSYPHPWRRIRDPLIAYFILMFALSGAFYLFGQMYVRSQENQFKQEYADLLHGMNQSYDQFEKMYINKFPAAKEKHSGQVVPIERLDREDLLERTEFLYKDLQSNPDSFPLFPNVPRVSDVLAWLTTHPYVAFTLADGSKESRLQIEDFNYSMVKRPMQGKKQEKYQVKVELEFSSPTPKWAREFHDSLIAPNDFVDPKGEVKWSSNRGRYRTSFYLKDKTSYNQ